MISFPNAKINIGLNVTARRPDGYHDIETVFYPIKLNDVLEIIEADTLTFKTSGTPIPGYANENLCLKAYELIKKDFSIPNITIHLHKNIPIGAGLGGGSADAAFFIKLINEKFELEMPLEQMEEYARKLGADCAFFLHNRPVFASGKGDILKDINLNLTDYFLVLVMPPVHVSTGEAYRGVKPKPAESSLKNALTLPVHEWKGRVKNDFEDSVFRNHPPIRRVKAELYEAGALYVSMTGSGAAVFGIFDNPVSLIEMEQQNMVFYNI